MGKLGILTFHTSHNEGAVLQSLALSRHLSQLLPEWRVEIVDLYYTSKQRWYDKRKTDRTDAIESFARKALPLSDHAYPVSGDGVEAMARIAHDYDALVYGSDEIWKLFYKSHFFGIWMRQASALHPAFPNAYWPYEASSIPKFAYAVCMGDTIPGQIPASHRDLMRTKVRALRLIGVRDDHTAAFVRSLDPTLEARLTKVPDPTFSVPLVADFDRQAARQKLSHWGVDFTRPVAAFVAHVPQVVQPAVERLRSEGYQSVALTLPNVNVDVDLSSKRLTPLEWLACFGLFTVAIAERMHACIACLLGGTPVIALDHHVDRLHPESKLKDLFAEFGLLQFHHPVSGESGDQLLDRCACVQSAWPAEQVEATIASHRARSLEFALQLRESLLGWQHASPRLPGPAHAQRSHPFV